MTKIDGIKEWSEIPLIEDGDILRGGVGGKANAQAIALANRMNWIKDDLKNVVTEVNGKTPLENKVTLLSQDIGAAALEHFHDEEYIKSFDITESDAGKVITVSPRGKGFELRMVSCLPVGSIIAFGGTKVPFGYLECNGALLGRSTYAGLFDAIGTTWGFTSSNDFKIPNFTEAERFLRSRSETLPVGTVQGDAIRNITGATEGGANWSSMAVRTGGTKGAFYPVDTNGGWPSSGGADANHSYSLGLDVSKVVPTASENRPKSAVVMYCIKVLDSVIDPEQVLAHSVVTEIANKVDRSEARELTGTRLWISGEYTPILNTPTIVTHGLNIDPNKCRCDVRLVCKVAEGGYSVGDTAIGLYAIAAPQYYICFSPTPMLSPNSIQFNTGVQGSGLGAIKKTTGESVTLTLANWRYIFRVWY